jgi:type III secretion system low calcium response chaperone LcrH/SycD
METKIKTPKQVLIEEVKKLDEKKQKKLLKKLEGFKDNTSLLELMEITPDMIEYFYTQTRQKYLRKEYGASSAAFRFLHKIAPMDARFAMGVAASEHMQKHYEDAVQWYWAADKLAPESPMALYHASDCYVNLNMPELAMHSLESALEKCKNNSAFADLEGKITLILESSKTKEVKK